MRLLVTGAAGFVGSTLVRGLLESRPGLEVVGLDNLHRPGSEQNREALRGMGVRFVHGDLRLADDLAAVGPFDWAVDAAALPSVLAGTGDPHGGAESPRQVLDHNLVGTLNLLEACRRHGAGLVLLSTSRVYSIDVLRSLPLVDDGDGFALAPGDDLPAGVTADGIAERCSTAPPVSLYGASKVASEQVALEYRSAFDLPVWVDRCGVLAGPGQFGTPGQGIFAYWVHAHREGAPLRYVGFGGSGAQVRDCLDPGDLVPLLLAQVDAGLAPERPPVCNVGGGAASARSLRWLTEWCAHRFGPVDVSAEPAERPNDLPWVVLDAGRAEEVWGWAAATPVEDVLEGIARHAEARPDWLARSAG